MRVLLTGGTGYLGSAIARARARRGHEPIVFARHATAARAAGLPGRAIDGDVRDASALHDAASGCDAICHSAALVSIWRRDPREFYDVNVGGLQNALAAAKAFAITRLVYTSSFLALDPAGPPSAPPLHGNDYQRTKASAERLARDAVDRGVPLVRLYPGVIYGPGVSTEGNLVGRLIADHLRHRLPGIIGADRIWSFAYVEDVADAHVTAIERGAPGAEYAVGGENAPQMRAFEIVRDLTGHPLPRRLPDTLAWILATVEEARARLLGATPLVTRGSVDILLRDWPLDISRAVAELDYRVTPLVSGISALLAR